MSEQLFTDADVERGAKALNDEGGSPGSSLHSWRCEDKERYPEPCACSEETIEAVLAACLPAIRERWLNGLANEWQQNNPLAPSPSVWLRAKAAPDRGHSDMTTNGDTP